MKKKKSIVLEGKKLRKLQMTEYDILVELDRICRKHDITYFLAGGTLIGAVRHDGFIPWDDDIDVSMTRDNYDKFIEVCSKELDSSKYYLESLETDDDCGMLYAKIRRKGSQYLEFTSERDFDKTGIWIDIFPIDKIKGDSFWYQLKFKYIYCMKMILLKKYGHLSAMEDKKKNFIIKIIGLLSIFYNKERLKRRLVKFMTKDNKKNTKKLVSYAGVYVGKEIFDSDCLDDVVEHKFEKGKFYIPKNYDKYLTHYYGDYMKLPPKEKRVTHPIVSVTFPDE